MADLKQLQDERLSLQNQIREHATESDKNGWTAEATAKWDELNAAYDGVKAKIDEENKALEAAAKRQARLAEIENEGGHPLRDRLGRDGGTLEEGPVNRDLFNPQNGGNDALVNSLQGWLMHASPLAGEIGEKHIQAARQTGNRIESPVFNFGLDTNWGVVRNKARTAIRNALSGQDGVAGGYTFGETFIGRLEMAMLAYGGVFQVAEVIRTGSGEPMRWPTADDTDNTGAQIGENPASIDNADPTFGQVIWNAYTFTSKIVKVPNELLQDSAFNLANTLAGMLGERLGRIQNTKYTTGSGASTAKGIVTCAASGVTAASATAIAFDEVIDLEHAVDPSRRNMPGVGYMFHDNVLKALRKLKDGNGRYLWQAGANTGAPDTLNNRPYTINQDMASSIATGATTMLFGQLSQYKIRQVASIVLRRLDERYADTNQVGFVAFVRGDGNLLDAGDSPVKKLVQA